MPLLLLLLLLQERVWFCTVKGLKPWLKPDGKNTKLNSQGGHTTWYGRPHKCCLVL